jgi:hypothetical protein
MMQLEQQRPFQIMAEAVVRFAINDTKNEPCLGIVGQRLL